MSRTLHWVARNLYIQTAGRSRTWIFRYGFQGRTHDLGLGPLHRVTVAKAEALAAELRDKLHRGVDPRQQKAPKTPSFKDVAAEYMQRVLPTLKSPRGWTQSINAYALPIIGAMPVSLIKPADVARVLSPLWISKRETARKLRSRIERIMNAAIAAGHFVGDNPARLALIESLLLQRPRKAVEHHAAMNWRALPEFMAELAAKKTLTASALQWTILTCVRTGETTGAHRSEIDGATWTIERTKTGKPLRVPLSRQALALIEGDRLLFPLSSTAMNKALKVMRPTLTVHGFRSTFKDYCAEHSIDHGVSEAALGHAVAKSATVLAYLRTDHLDARRVLMQRWADFLLPRPRIVRPSRVKVHRSRWVTGL